MRTSRASARRTSGFAERGYLALNITAIEAGTLKRDHHDAEMEAKFHLMLLEIARLAILANSNAVPRHTGLYAGLLRPESP